MGTEGVSTGHHLRVLPDGSIEFVLEEPALSCVVIDDRVTLRFGRTHVAIAGPFDLEVDGVGHHLDPRWPDTLGPLLATFPGTARWVWASVEGDLTIVFMQGQRLVVPAPAVRTAWSVGDGSSDEPLVDGGTEPTTSSP